MVQVKGSQIASRVKRQFGDESGVQVTNADIIMWLNDALREATTQNTAINLKRVNVPSVAGAGFFNIPDPENMAGIHSVQYKTEAGSQYFPLRYLTPNELSELVPDWNQSPATGIPTFYSSDASGKLYVYPPPSVSYSLGYSVLYNSFFTEYTDLDVVMEISPRYYQYLLEYCLMKAYEMDENWEAADRKASFIQSTLNVLSSTDNDVHQSRYPFVSVNPEDL